jgi:sortase A
MKPLIARIGHGLLLAGMLTLSYAALSWGYAGAFQTYQHWVFDQSPVASRPSDTGPPPHSVIGRLEIPRLDLSVMILEGADEQDLSLGVGRVPGTALPGQDGNVVIAGHRDTFFQPLRKIKENDLITLATLRGSTSYIVEFIKITDPQDVAVLRSTPEPSLTLITCYPFGYLGSAPERFVVRAREIH